MDPIEAMVDSRLPIVDINACLSQADHPLQALVFIPKADKGAYADNYRPLDMPDTCDRIIDSAIYAVLAESFKESLHPAQALLNHFKEPQANYAQMQHYLELKDAQYTVMLSDFAKAFERVNPWWVLQCLAARAAPAWIKAYVIHLMFGRRTQHKVQGFLLEPISIHQGLAMGRATSVVLFCLALDPLIWALHDISSFIRLTAYMDDNSAASKGLHWVERHKELSNQRTARGYKFSVTNASKQGLFLYRFSLGMSEHA